jgi:hypothetical protein
MTTTRRLAAILAADVVGCARRVSWARMRPGLRGRCHEGATARPIGATARPIMFNAAFLAIATSAAAIRDA